MSTTTCAVRRVRGVRRFGLGTFPTPGVLPFAALLWLALFVVMVGLTFAIAHWGTVDTSIWEQASQPVRWGILFIGVWVVQTYLATYVAHGVTRRSFADRTAGLGVALAALIAGLSTLGFVVEGLVYDVQDWPQRLSDDHIFDDPDNLPVIFASYFLLFLVWFAAGVLNAVAFYRDDGGWSIVSIPLTVVVVAGTETALDGEYPSFVTRVTGFLDDVPTLAGLALWATGLALLSGLTWGLLRDIPIRAKGS